MIKPIDISIIGTYLFPKMRFLWFLPPLPPFAMDVPYIFQYPLVSSNMAVENRRTEWRLVSLGTPPISMVHFAIFVSQRVNPIKSHKKNTIQPAFSYGFSRVCLSIFHSTIIKTTIERPFSHSFSIKTSFSYGFPRVFPRFAPRICRTSRRGSRLQRRQLQPQKGAQRLRGVAAEVAGHGDVLREEAQRWNLGDGGGA